jgi:hypothetical protein
METLTVYWLKINAIVSILFLAYWLLLRNEKFFKLNRLFLMGSLVLAFVLPMVPVINNPGVNRVQREVTALNPLYSLYDIGFANDVNAGGEIEENKRQPAAPAQQGLLSDVSVQEVMFALYVGVWAVLLVRFAYQLINLFLLIRKTNRQRVDGITYCEHNEALSPFSFFNYLIINKSPYNAEQYNQIMLHERAHIRQAHTLDLLVTEIVHIFLWINPVMIFFKQYVKINLEYLADNDVLEAGVDKKSYQYSILQACMQTETYPLTNLFTSSKLKLRIKMMNSRRTPLARVYKYTLVLPLVVALYFVIHPYAKALPLTEQQQDQLKAFEGKYKMALQNDVVYLQITAKGNELVLKQLWDDQEITFKQESELAFYNSAQNFPIKFIKGPMGDITKMLAFNKDLWTKEGAQPQKEIVLSKQQLNTFTGYYQYQQPKEGYVQCVVRGNNLIGIQLWTKKEFVFTALSESEFISKEGITAKFTKDKAGVVTEVLVSNSEVLKKVKEPKEIVKKEATLTQQQLDGMVGYYHMRDNIDLVMQVSHNGNDIRVKQLWDDAEQTFMPISAVEIFSKGAMLTIKFTKGTNGQITQLQAAEGKIWDKGQKPEEKVAINLSASNLKAFDGNYSMPYQGNVMYLEITSTEKGLILKQLWDGQQINFYPISELEFYNKEKAFPLKFIQQDGKIAQVEAFRKDLWSRVN